MSTSDNNLFLIRSLLVDEVRRLQAILDAKDGEITSLSGIEPLEEKAEAGEYEEANDLCRHCGVKLERFYVCPQCGSDFLGLPSPAAIPEGLPKCVWSEDADGTWSTSCHHEFQWNEGGPADNHANFCLYCGKPLTAAEWEDQYGDGDDASSLHTPDAALRGTGEGTNE